MILIILQAYTLLISQEVHYSIRYKYALIAVRYTIKYTKGVAWK